MHWFRMILIIISLNSINQFFFVMEIRYDLFEAVTEFLIII
jgi:hypothetical protein